MTSTPENDEQAPDDAVEMVDAVADARLIDAHDLALAALYEITPAATVGAPAGYTLEEGGVVSLRFANTMPGYPNWLWTVSVAVVDGAEPRISLTCESRLVDLERAEVRRYTDADQQAEYPGDRFFEFVPALQEAEIRLPAN